MWGRTQKTKKPGKGKNNREKKTAKAEEKKDRRENKKVSVEGSNSLQMRIQKEEELIVEEKVPRPSSPPSNSSMSIQKEEAKKKEVPVAFSDCDEIYYKIVDGQYVLIRYPPSPPSPPSESSNENKVQDPKGNEWTVYSCDSMIHPRTIAMAKYLAGEISEEDYLNFSMEEEYIGEVD